MRGYQAVGWSCQVVDCGGGVARLWTEGEGVARLWAGLPGCGRGCQAVGGVARLWAGLPGCGRG